MLSWYMQIDSLKKGFVIPVILVEFIVLLVEF